MIRVVCWKWEPLGPKRDRVRYTAEHVNRLALMVGRHLSVPHEVVCITDDPEGIDGGVRIVPMWNDLLEFGMCYTRLRVFSPEMADVIGPRFISIDLDCVVVGSLDPIVNAAEDFRAWRNVGRGATYCGSLFLMDAGARKEVWDRFDPSRLKLLVTSKKIKRRGDRYIHPDAYESGMVIGSDQAWISYVLGPHEAVWHEAHGVLSHRDPRLAPGKLGRARVNDPPEGVRIVFFHGTGDPSLPETQKQFPWIEKHWN